MSTMTHKRIATTKHGVKLTIGTSQADETRVCTFEARIGARLPDDYRDFLLEFNGGAPEPARFDLALRSGPYTGSSVRRFLPLDDKGSSNLENFWDVLQERVPPHLLPIASDAFGNFVLLGLAGNHRGKIYFWDHEREPETEPDWSNIDLVAESFDAFMGCLQPSK